MLQQCALSYFYTDIRFMLMSIIKVQITRKRNCFQSIRTENFKGFFSHLTTDYKTIIQVSSSHSSLSAFLLLTSVFKGHNSSIKFTLLKHDKDSLPGILPFKGRFYKLIKSWIALMVYRPMFSVLSHYFNPKQG